MVIRKKPIFRKKTWFVVAFAIFLVAAILGLTMRYMMVNSLPFLSFRNLVHAHSHIAHMGWAFLLTTGAIIYFFKPLFHRSRPIVITLVLNIISVVGMTATFIPQGYAPASIAFSTLHLIAGFYFGIYVLRRLKTIAAAPSGTILRLAIYCYLISSIGLIAIGPISAKLGATHFLYHASIEFFMHFQFNGWHMLTALALLMKFLENKGVQFNLPKFVYPTLFVSIVLTFLPNITHALSYKILYAGSAIGLILQTLVYILFFKAILKPLLKTKFHSRLVRYLFLLGILSFITKVTIQTGAAIPTIALVAQYNHYFVIGFIHLIMLGAITFTLSSLLLHSKVLPLTKSSRIGWIMLAMGLVLTETTLFTQGTLLWARLGAIPQYSLVLFVFSVPLPIGLVFILFSFLKSTHAGVKKAFEIKEPPSSNGKEINLTSVPSANP